MLRPVKAGLRGHDDGSSGASRRDVTGTEIGGDLSSGNRACPVVLWAMKDNVSMTLKTT